MWSNIKKKEYNKGIEETRGPRGEVSVPDRTTNGNQSALKMPGFKFNCSFKVVNLSGANESRRSTRV